MVNGSTIKNGLQSSVPVGLAAGLCCQQKILTVKNKNVILSNVFVETVRSQNQRSGLQNNYLNITLIAVGHRLPSMSTSTNGILR